jgi:hypothetical protein
MRLLRIYSSPDGESHFDEIEALSTVSARVESFSLRIRVVRATSSLPAKKSLRNFIKTVCKCGLIIKAFNRFWTNAVRARGKWAGSTSTM